MMAGNEPFHIFDESKYVDKLMNMLKSLTDLTESIRQDRIDHLASTRFIHEFLHQAGISGSSHLSHQL